MIEDVKGQNEVNERAINKILKYKQEGYLFHGSVRADIEVLEPRKAEENNPDRLFNIDNAVFASKLPEVSIIFACLNKSSLPKGQGSEQHSVGIPEGGEKTVAKIPTRWKETLQNSRGYNIYPTK